MSQRPTLILPADIWWLLRVNVEHGASTPYHLWLLWSYQLATAWEFDA